LIYAVGGIELVNIGNSGSTVGNYVIFNNTFQTTPNQVIFNCNYLSGGTLADVNNHFIDDGTQYSSPCNNKTSTTVLAMTNATATTDGYTSSQTYGYSPTAGGSPTVGTGTNKYSAYCGALGTAGLTAAQTACESDVDYACTYNSSSHTVSCPARTALARPTSSAWDIGAYQFSAATQIAVPTPGMMLSRNY
jgi:hypothetical protein